MVRNISKNIFFIYLFMIIKGVDTARNAADHLDIHLLDALNQMLDTQDNETIKHGEPVRSSQLDLPKLRAAIVKTYYELDRDLRTLIKDESGCVCVSFILFKKKNLNFVKYLDNMSSWSGKNLFN
jgi:hypothetical protein